MFKAFATAVLLIRLCSIASAEDLEFRSGIWKGHINYEKTGCSMLSPFSDGQSSLVVEMIDDSDITIGIYWHRKKFAGLSDRRIPGSVIVDSQPPAELEGRFVREDYLRFTSKNTGLLKHLFTAGAQARLEYSTGAWATFGLRGTSKAVNLLHYCWLQQRRLSTLETEEQPAAQEEAAIDSNLNTYVNITDDQNQADLLVSSCSAEESHECISHMIRCSAGGNIEFYITGDENPRRVIDIVSNIATSSYQQSRFDVLFDNGNITIGMHIWSAGLEYSDMDGWWNLTLDSGESSNFLDALSKYASSSFDVSLLGRKYVFPAASGDALNFTSFVSACLKYQP